MEHAPLVLLANEPGAYRSVLAEGLPALRPHLRVLEVHPAELDLVVPVHRPTVVVCSREFDVVADVEFTVVMLYPGGEDTLVRRVNGTRHTLVSPQLSDVLSAIDSAILQQAS
jgi:hypothetical protein